MKKSVLSVSGLKQWLARKLCCLLVFINTEISSFSFRDPKLKNKKQEEEE